MVAGCRRGVPLARTFAGRPLGRPLLPAAAAGRCCRDGGGTCRCEISLPFAVAKPAPGLLSGHDISTRWDYSTTGSIPQSRNW
eukprot:118970-Chlamydomonas_euryale.AAC.4